MVASAPRLILVTGNMAAGKSTVAEALAKRLERSVHLRGDAFRRMIVGGRAELGASLSEEAARQLDLRYRIAESAARLYLAAGFSVVYQDIFLGPGLTDAARRFQDLPLFVVVLCPDSETLARRDAERSKTGYASRAAIGEFERLLRKETPRIGFWLDSTSLTVEETVEEILAYIPGLESA